MRAQDLWYTVVEEDLPVPGEDAREDEKLRYKNHTINKHKAASLLHDALTESMFTKIANCNTPKKIFDRLKAIHEGGDQIRKIHIRNRISDFEANRMSYKETVQDYYDRTIEIVNEIRALGGELPEEKVVEKATMSLPNKFEAKLCALEETDKLKQITFLELISALQAYEKRMQIRPPEVEGVHEKTEVLLSAENLDLSNLAISRGASNLQAPSKGGYVQQNPLKKGGNGKEIYEPCPHCKKTNHRAQFCFYHPKVICKNCGKTGHVERVCIHKNRAKEHANLVDLSLFDEECNLEIAFCTETSPDSVEITYSVDETTTQSIKGWILDSGCSHHICCDRTLLFNFKTQKGRAVRSATGHTTPVLGVGSIYLSRGKKPMIVEDVLNGVIAYEMWHNEKLSLNHLRVYGSICHVHVPEKKRTKLDEKSKIGILVGYCSGIRGYRVFDPVGGKIIISRDIIFEEDKEWDWIGNGIKNSSIIFFNALSKTDQEATKEQTTPSWPMTNEQVITPSTPEIVQNEDQGENGANSDLHDAESTPGTPGNIENEIPDQNSDASGFTRSYVDYSLYVKRSENQVLLVSVYVDDLLITANNPSLITSFKDSVMKEFQMTDLGLMTYFLGMEVHQKKGVGTFVGQTKYCMDLLHKYGMNEVNPVVCPTDYKGAITSITGREKPDAATYRAHLAAAKRALRNYFALNVRWQKIEQELYMA
ncbi:hypothetical protein ZIOFF_057886 [Zingiber officinale]|uniref:CCHC-type domain-containing protein n=1 Tax=Zingiber officinale TaxID=94328 RepID=A0A8J5KAH0_ZINOF|nr:hypothetical protein ZIOFF_057886 [Zingiber officinale]